MKRSQCLLPIILRRVATSLEECIFLCTRHNHHRYKDISLSTPSATHDAHSSTTPPRTGTVAGSVSASVSVALPCSPNIKYLAKLVFGDRLRLGSGSGSGRAAESITITYCVDLQYSILGIGSVEISTRPYLRYLPPEPERWPARFPRPFPLPFHAPPTSNIWPNLFSVTGFGWVPAPVPVVQPRV